MEVISYLKSDSQSVCVDFKIYICESNFISLICLLFIGEYRIKGIFFSVVAYLRILD